ncbi:hypothetical protein AOLI_G00310640 [Acnodon oligacanthus]
MQISPSDQSHGPDGAGRINLGKAPIRAAVPAETVETSHLTSAFMGPLSGYQDPPAKPWALGQPPMRPADKRPAEWLPRLELHYERPRLLPVIFHHLQAEEIPYDATEPGNSSLRQVLPVPRLTRFCCSQ